MPDEVSDETVECEFCAKPQKNKLELEKHVAQYHIETFDSSDDEASKKSNEAVPDEVSDEICEVEDAEKCGTKSAIKCQKVPHGLIKVKPPSFFKKTITAPPVSFPTIRIFSERQTAVEFFKNNIAFHFAFI